MAVLTPSTLETISINTSGWSTPVNSNFQKTNTKLGILMSSTTTPGSTSVANPNALTSETLTDSSGGTATNTISAVAGTGDDATINSNNASLVDEVNKLTADVLSLRTQVVALLDALRKTGGCGVLNN